MSTKLINIKRDKDSGNPLIYFYNNSAQTREYRRLYRKVMKTKDHRSFVLVATLVIENRIDRILRAYLPGYQKLIDKEIAFSIKIDLLRALNMVPNVLPDTATFFRQVRNDFAHNLRCDSLARMNEKRKNKLEQLSNPPPRRKRRFSLRQKMFGLFNEFMAYSQLHLMNAEMIQYTLRSKRFQKLMDEKYPAFQKLKEDIPSQ